MRALPRAIPGWLEDKGVTLAAPGPPRGYVHRAARAMLDEALADGGCLQCFAEARRRDRRTVATTDPQYSPSRRSPAATRVHR
jgi:hypothetical protein